MTVVRSASRATREPTVPPLENGAHLTVAEFLRRYEAMPELKKAELIEGVVHMGSPVSRDHGRPDGRMLTCLGYYSVHTPGTELLPNTTVMLDVGENCPQPDGLLRIEPEYGGRSRTSAQQYVEGAAELAAEIAASSVSYDLHEKFGAYERNGISEYLVWRVEDDAIDWFYLHDRKYRALTPRGGIVKSRIFPGLWLDVAAMLRGDMVAVLQTLDQGLASDAHGRFVARLAKRKRQA
jgi:Uma2 family endonuclease